MILSKIHRPSNRSVMSSTRSFKPALAAAARTSASLECVTPLVTERSSRVKRLVSFNSASHARLTSLQRSRVSTGRSRNTARTKQRGRGERTSDEEAGGRRATRPRVSIAAQGVAAVRRCSSSRHAKAARGGRAGAKQTNSSSVRKSGAAARAHAKTKKIQAPQVVSPGVIELRGFV